MRLKTSYFFLACMILLTTGLMAEKGALQKRVADDGTIHFYSKQEQNAQSICSTDVPYSTIIKRYALMRNLDPCLIIAIIEVESSFRPNAVSVSGAMGLMQLMQGTAAYYDINDPLDPEENIRVGTAHLAYLVRYFKGDIVLAVAAYHAGQGRVKKAGGVPPIRSTVAYVNRVMKRYNNTNIDEDRVKRLFTTIDEEGTLIISDR